MEKIITILVLAALPALTMASGDHAGDNHMSVGHTMDQRHGSAGMRSMSRGSHEADAGRPGDPGRVSRTIEVTMEDAMRFVPDQLKFKSGETVRFVVRNDGKIKHEMVIGSVDELKEHANMMRANPAMKHDDPNMIALAAGQRGDLVWQFDNVGTFDLSCLVPGHLEAGMTGKIEVE